MRRGRPAIAGLLLLAGTLAVAGIPGCSRPIKTQFLPNQRPTVRLTYAPVDTTHEEFYVYRINWVGFDADGRVTHFEYVVDPPSQVGSDTPWVSTTRNEQTITFSATRPESLGTPRPRSQSFHILVVRSVDDRGAPSEPVKRAFFSFGVAPIVQIDEPRPSALLAPVVTPSVRVRWTGKDFIDPNGFVFEKPVKYKFKIFKNSPEIPWTKWLQNGDSLRADVAPAFDGWDETGPDSASVQYTNLTPGSLYLFVVVAIGRSGAYSPIFSLDSNMLIMSVGYAGALGPKITIFNSFFSYTYPSGGFPSPLDLTWAVQIQVPSGQPVTFNWTAEPPAGSLMKRYRWVLDLNALDDETPRSSQDDWYHWSPWSLNATTAMVGPFQGAGGDTGEVHNFYIEAEDLNGLVSLGWVQFRVFKPTFDRDLLIVNDTRFSPDQVAPTQPPGRSDSLRAPSGTWPTCAELDTFLFAQGGVRWKMTQNGKLSPVGIFKGYAYDTLGTRIGRDNATLSLATLGHYLHVVWMTDPRGSTFRLSPTSNTEPMTTLLYMSMPNRQNTLATWVSQGGLLWGLGGGFGNATNSPWNNLANDGTVRIYRFDGSRPDLTPGRFMFDLCHWRSEFRIFNNAFVRFARFDQRDPSVTFPYPPGYWKGGIWTNPAADYTSLPRQLGPREPATDPIWPYRSQSDFYINNPSYSGTGASFEYLAELENVIIEPIPTPTQSNPDSTTERVTLDSLYLVYGPSYPGQLMQPGSGVNVIMTVYHGLENPLLAFSGADIWSFRRSDCQALVDFVLQRLWGLSRGAPRVARATGSVLASPARSAGARGPTPVPVGRGGLGWSPQGPPRRR